MKFSSKVEKCGQSPMRKFHPYAVAAKARGIKVYHLNIGQPDVQTPPAFFEAIRKFEQPVLEYAPSPGIPELIDAIKGYYDKLDMHFDKSEIYITTGGSEALAITLQCILDDGDEILIPEPFYPNYNTMVRTCGASITPIPTCPEEGYHYAEREKIEPLINEHTRAIMVTNPGNPTGVVLTDDEMKMLVDLAKKHDLFLIGDEAYREFVYGGEPLQSFGSFAEDYTNFITLFLEFPFCLSDHTGDSFAFCQVFSVLPMLLVLLAGLTIKVGQMLRVKNRFWYFLIGMTWMVTYPWLRMSAMLSQPDWFGLIFGFSILLLTLDFRFEKLEPVRFCLLFLLQIKRHLFPAAHLRRHGGHHPHPALVLIFCGGLLLCLRGAGAGKQRAHCPRRAEKAGAFAGAQPRAVRPDEHGGHADPAVADGQPHPRLQLRRALFLL